MNNLEKKIPDAATLIHTNHTTQINNIQKKKKNGDVDKKKNTRYKWFGDYNYFEYKNYLS